MKNKISILILSAFLFQPVLAHADIFGPRPERKLSATQNEQLAFPVDPITVVGEISDKLGTKEGWAFDRWGGANYICSTLYTYTGFGVPIGFNVGVVGTDGIGETIDFNLGSVLPADNDPLTGILQYAWAGGGMVERDMGGNWETSWLADIQIKFSFN